MQEYTYSIGIIPDMENMTVIVYNHETKRSNEFKGNLFEMFAWINKSTNLSRSIAIIQNVNMIDYKFESYEKIKTSLRKKRNYEIWTRRKNMNGYIPPEYSDAELRSDTFKILEEYKKGATMQAVQKIVTQAFKMRNVDVFGCDGTPIRDKIKQRINTDRRIPRSIPSGRNDNEYLIKSKKNV